MRTKNETVMDLIPGELVERSIYVLRGKNVMLDYDLAKLYGVETKALKRAVKRNLYRFPEDFMFELNQAEDESLRYQFGTSKKEGRGGRRYRPYAFTEQGVAMLSSILNSKTAVLVNIQIMRTFTKLREMLSTHKELRDRINQLERKYDQQFKSVFDAIKNIIEPITQPKQIGFITNSDTKTSAKKPQSQNRKMALG